MLTIYGNRNYGGFCDRMGRRDFLTIGGMALGGLAMPELLRAEAQPGARSHKAIINVFLPGGPPHIDMWDLKPDAPAEIRGEYSPIKTNVPGMEICELFPKLAKMADKFAIIRSLSDSAGDLSAYQCMTGHVRGREQPPPGGWPSFGSWLSKLKGNANPGVPPNISLMYRCGNFGWGDSGDGGFLGLGHSPFKVVFGSDESLGKMMLPEAVDHHASGKRILFPGQPVGQFQPPTAGILFGQDITSKNVQPSPRHFVPEFGRLAPLLDASVDRGSFNDGIG